MDKISRISMFLAVVEHASFAGAARALGVTGPAISKQVQALEEQLGVKLLHRTTRQVTLSEEGLIYSERAKRALADLQEAENQIQELKASPTGTLKINAPMSFGKQYLTKPIAAFAKNYPSIELEVHFDDRQVDIISEGYDVVIRIGALNDSTLVARALAPCPIILCAAKSFLANHGPIQTPQALSNLPAILYTKHNNDTQWRYQDTAGKISAVHLKRHFCANNADMMTQACLEGLGVALLPIFSAAKHLEEGKLVHLLKAFQTYPARNIYAIYPQNRHLSTRARLFIDWIIQWRETLPW